MQAVQSAHAALAFAVAHPGLTKDWHDSSQVLVLLSVRDESALESLRVRLWARGHAHAAFTEPDFNGALTAIAAGPGAAALLSRLPLALRREVMTDD